MVNMYNAVKYLSKIVPGIVIIYFQS